jgi:hypothetical protein
MSSAPATPVLATAVLAPVTPTAIASPTKPSTGVVVNPEDLAAAVSTAGKRTLPDAEPTETKHRRVDPEWAGHREKIEAVKRKYGRGRGGVTPPPRVDGDSLSTPSSPVGWKGADFAVIAGDFEGEEMNLGHLSTANAPPVCPWIHTVKTTDGDEVVKTVETVTPAEETVKPLVAKTFLETIRDAFWKAVEESQTPKESWLGSEIPMIASGAGVLVARHFMPRGLSVFSMTAVYAAAWLYPLQIGGSWFLSRATISAINWISK